ncbi:MAG: hypothetical protein ACLFTH_04600 [Candidatus Woesearchaeota archaeon]
MTKMFSREKRKLSKTGGRNRAPRPKTFASEEAAKKWAEAKGLKKYQLEDLRPESQRKKIRVVPEE